MVGRDAEPDEAPGGRQALDHVDLGGRVGCKKGAGGIEACRPRADDCDPERLTRLVGAHRRRMLRGCRALSLRSARVGADTGTMRFSSLVLVRRPRRARARGRRFGGRPALRALRRPAGSRARVAQHLRRCEGLEAPGGARRAAPTARRSSAAAIPAPTAPAGSRSRQAPPSRRGTSRGRRPTGRRSAGRVVVTLTPRGVSRLKAFSRRAALSGSNRGVPDALAVVLAGEVVAQPLMDQLRRGKTSVELPGLSRANARRAAKLLPHARRS